MTSQSGGASYPGVTTLDPNGLEVDGSLIAGSPFDATNPNGIRHTMNGALTINSYQGEYVNLGGPMEVRQLATLSAEGGRLNPAMAIVRIVDRTVAEQIQVCFSVGTFPATDSPELDPSELISAFQSSLSQAQINAAGMMGENGKTPPTAPAAITGALTSATLAQLTDIVAQLLVALDAKGSVTNSTT